jgi:hypothetical protein
MYRNFGSYRHYALSKQKFPKSSFLMCEQIRIAQLHVGLSIVGSIISLTNGKKMLKTPPDFFNPRRW